MLERRGGCPVYPAAVNRVQLCFALSHFVVTKLLWGCTGPVFFSAAAAAVSLQSCPTLCDPTDGSLQGSPVPGILQARTLEWVAISFANA